MKPLDRITVKVGSSGTLQVKPQEIEFIKAYRSASPDLRHAVDTLLDTEPPTVKYTDTGKRIEIIGGQGKP